MVYQSGGDFCAVAVLGRADGDGIAGAGQHLHMEGLHLAQGGDVDRTVSVSGGNSGLPVALPQGEDGDRQVAVGAGGGPAAAVGHVAAEGNGLVGYSNTGHNGVGRGTEYIFPALAARHGIEVIVPRAVAQHGHRHQLVSFRAAAALVAGGRQGQGRVSRGHRGVAAQGIAVDSGQVISICLCLSAGISGLIPGGNGEGGCAAVTRGGIGGGAGEAGGGIVLAEQFRRFALIPLHRHACQVGAVAHREGDGDLPLAGDGEGCGQADLRAGLIEGNVIIHGIGSCITRIVLAGDGHGQGHLAGGGVGVPAQIAAADMQIIGIVGGSGQGAGGLLIAQQPVGAVIFIRCVGTVGNAVAHRESGGNVDAQRDLLPQGHAGAAILVRHGKGDGDVPAVAAGFYGFYSDLPYGHLRRRHVQPQLLHHQVFAHSGGQRIARHVAQGAVVGGLQGDDADSVALQGHPVARPEGLEGQDGAVAHVVDVVHGVGYAAEAHLNGVSIAVLHVEDGGDAAVLGELGVAVPRPQPHLFIQGEGEGQVVPHAGPGGGGGDVAGPIPIGTNLVALGHVALGVKPGIAGGHVVQVQAAVQFPAAGPAEGVARQVGDQAVDGEAAIVHGAAVLVQQLQVIAVGHPALLAGFNADHGVVHVLPAGYGVGEDQLATGEGIETGLDGRSALAGGGADEVQVQLQIIVGHAVGKTDGLAHLQGEVEGLPALVGGAANLIARPVADVDSGEGGRCRVGEVDIDLAHLGAAAGAVGGAHAEAEIGTPGGEHAAAGVGAGHPVRVVGAVAHLHNGGGVVAGVQIGLGPVGQVLVRAEVHMPVRRQRGADGGGNLHGGEQLLQGLPHVRPLVGGPPLAVLAVHIGAGGVQNIPLPAADADSVLLRCQFGKVAVHMEAVRRQHLGADKAAVIGRLGGQQVGARHVGVVADRVRRPGGQGAHQGQNQAQGQNQTEPALSSFHSSNHPFFRCLFRSTQRLRPSRSVSSVHSPCTK